MAKHSRIIVQTSTRQKDALQQALYDTGINITDWLKSKIEESTMDYPISSMNDLLTLGALKDSKNVFNTLQSIDWDFSEADTGFLTHDIHPYPAKYIPHIPSHLISQLSLRGETVWDPFGGSGTTALEAILLGRKCLSTDANPLCEIIGKAKTITLTKEHEDSLNEFYEKLLLLANSVDTLELAISSDWEQIKLGIPDIPNIEEWFHPVVIKELAYVKFLIQHLRTEECRTVAHAAFSRIILRASYQDSETRYVRKPKDVKIGFVCKLMANDMSAIIIKIRQTGTLLQFRQPTFKTFDLRKSIADTVLPNSVDLVVTSPPYPNANDYHLYHRFRLFWLGYDPRDLSKVEIGSHLRHQKEKNGMDNYIYEMTQGLSNCYDALRPGRFAVLVVGDAIFEGKLIDTANELGIAAKKLGYEVLGAIKRNIHKTKRSFISPARRARDEKLLVLRKPSTKVNAILVKAPYKLWAYEDTLRLLEAEKVLDIPIKKIGNDNLGVNIEALDIDKLRKLTFTHYIESDKINNLLTWQAVLENGDAFSMQKGRKDPKYVTHGIHNYKGKFYPQLAKALFNIAALQPKQIILDPFAGSGTVLLEAYLNGFYSYGCDMNPLAVKIAKAKTDILSVDSYVRDRLLARFADKLLLGSDDDKWFGYFPDKVRDEIESWFPKLVANKLGWILTEIRDIPNTYVQEFLRILLSSIIRNISQQDPYDLRIRRRKEPLKDAPVFELYRKVIQYNRIRLQHFAERTKESPYRFQPVTSWYGDSRNYSEFLTNGLKDHSVDGIITSPPYATALPYIDTDRLSILVLLNMIAKERSPIETELVGSREISQKNKSILEENIENKIIESISSRKAQALIKQVYSLNAKADVGFRRKNMGALLMRYFSDMEKIIVNLDKLLKKKGQAFFVIGDNLTTAGDKVIKIESTAILTEIAQNMGWELRKAFPITVTMENAKHIKHAITENTILWFNKKS